MPLYRQQDASGLVLPVETRTTAIDGDFVFMIDATTNIPYRITKADLLAGLSGGSGGSSGGGTGSGNFANVQLLLHGNGTSIIDSSSFARTLTVVGATPSTTQSKFGGKSIYFDGSSSISTPSTGGLNFGTGDFSVEGFIYPLSLPSDYAVIAGGFITPSQRWDFYLANNISGGSGLSFTDGTTVIAQTSSNASLSSLGWMVNTWYYVAAKRVSGVVTLAIQGATVASGSLPTNFSNEGTLTVGRYVDANPLTFNGYMDELRITSGIAQDISSVPTAEFPSS